MSIKLLNSASAFPKYFTNPASHTEIKDYSFITEFIKSYSVEFFDNSTSTTKDKDLQLSNHILSKIIHRGIPTFTPLIVEEKLTKYLKKYNIPLKDLQKSTNGRELGAFIDDKEEFKNIISNSFDYLLYPFNKDSMENMASQPFIDSKSKISGRCEDHFYQLIQDKFGKEFQQLFLRQALIEDLIGVKLNDVCDIQRARIDKNKKINDDNKKNQKKMINGAFKSFKNNRVDFIFFAGTKKIVIEIDENHHKESAEKFHDQQRDKLLEDYCRENILEEGGSNVDIWRIKIDTTIPLDSDKNYKEFHRYLIKLEDIYKKYSKNKKNKVDQKVNQDTFRKDPAFLIFIFPTLIQKSLSAINILFQNEVFHKKSKLNLYLNEEDYPSFIDALNTYYFLFDAVNDIAKNKINLPMVDITYIGEKPILNIAHKKINVLSKKSKKFDLLIDNSSVLFSHQLSKNHQSKNNLDSVVSKNKHIRIRKYFSVRNLFKMSHASLIEHNPYDLKKLQKEKLQFFLGEIFRKKDFFEGQYGTIKKLLNRENTIALLPTGGGKSIIFQLSGILLPGPTLVVDPLISLINDQFVNLANLGLSSTGKTTSQLTATQKDIVQKCFASGEYLFMYIAPERLQIQEFRASLRSIPKRMPISLTVVDEAHTVSEWGHDFRPSYLQMGRNLEKFCSVNKDRKTTVVGLTGTASDNVLKDIKVELDIKNNDNVIIPPQGFDRKDISFKVIKCETTDEKDKKLELLLKDTIPNYFDKKFDNFFDLSVKEDKHLSHGGVIFTTHASTEKKSTSTVNIESLLRSKEIPKNNEKYPNLTYYGSLPTKVKNQTQTDFKESKTPLIIATKSFGMGIDKSNISYVIHYTHSASIESFYQEAGRAGRSFRYQKKPALAYSMYTDSMYSEARKILSISNNSEAMKKLKSYGNNPNAGDLHNQVWFLLSNFPDKDAEKEDMRIFWRKYIRGKKSTSVTAKFLPNGTDTQKVLFRFMRLNLVKDYTIRYKPSAIYDIEVNKYDDNTLINALDDYLSNYMNEGMVKKKIHQFKAKINLLEKLSQTKIDVLKETVFTTIDELTDFVYYDIFSKRRRALEFMSELCHEYKDEDTFRKGILDFLQENEFSEQIRGLTSENAKKDNNIEKAKNITKNITSNKKLDKILGAAKKSAQENPDSPLIQSVLTTAKIKNSDIEDESVYQELIRLKSNTLKSFNEGAIRREEAEVFFTDAINDLSKHKKTLKNKAIKMFINSPIKSKKMVLTIIKNDEAYPEDFLVNTISDYAINKVKELNFFEDLNL
jgi:ATP-dependent DNA helicase RecQ